MYSNPLYLFRRSRTIRLIPGAFTTTKIHWFSADCYTARQRTTVLSLVTPPLLNFRVRGLQTAAPSPVELPWRKSALNTVTCFLFLSLPVDTSSMLGGHLSQLRVTINYIHHNTYSMCIWIGSDMHKTRIHIVFISKVQDSYLRMSSYPIWHVVLFWTSQSKFPIKIIHYILLCPSLCSH